MSGPRAALRWLLNLLRARAWLDPLEDQERPQRAQRNAAVAKAEALQRKAREQQGRNGRG